MYDRELVLDALRNIEETLEHLLERTSWIKTVDDFATSAAGMDMLDVAAIRLLTVRQMSAELW